LAIVVRRLRVRNYAGCPDAMVQEPAAAREHALPLDPITGARALVFRE
jgi:hypothetical protein